MSVFCIQYVLLGIDKNMRLCLFMKIPLENKFLLFQINFKMRFIVTSCCLIFCLSLCCDCTPLGGTSIEACSCTCGNDGKRCVLAPGSIFDLFGKGGACKCDLDAGTCLGGFEFSGNFFFFEISIFKNSGCGESIIFCTQRQFQGVRFQGFQFCELRRPHKPNPKNEP